MGRTITIPHWGLARNLPVRVVGVVGHIEQYGVDGSQREKPQIYYSFYQLPDEIVPDFRVGVSLAVRTLYGVGSADPLTFLAVSLVLLGAVVLACYVPACRAARLDPMISLRHE